MPRKEEMAKIQNKSSPHIRKKKKKLTHTSYPGIFLTGKALQDYSKELFSLNSQVKATQPCLTLCDPMDYAIHGIIQARILEYWPFPPPGNLPNPGIKPRFPTLQTDSLPAEPQWKPKNTEVSSFSLLQGIFPTPGKIPPQNRIRVSCTAG